MFRSPLQALPHLMSGDGAITFGDLTGGLDVLCAVYDGQRTEAKFVLL